MNDRKALFNQYDPRIGQRTFENSSNPILSERNMLQYESGVHDLLDSLSSMMYILGNKTRVRILYLLWRNYECDLYDLTQTLNITTLEVSRHIKKLWTHYLILSRRDAEYVYFRLNPETELHVYLTHFFENLLHTQGTNRETWLPLREYMRRTSPYSLDAA